MQIILVRMMFTIRILSCDDTAFFQKHHETLSGLYYLLFMVGDHSYLYETWAYFRRRGLGFGWMSRFYGWLSCIILTDL